MQMKKQKKKTEQLAKLKTRKGGLGKNERLGGEPARVIQAKIRDLKKEYLHPARLSTSPWGNLGKNQGFGK